MLGLGLTETLLVVVAGIFLAIHFLKPKQNLPPGPPGLPFFGNMFQMMSRPHLKHFEWAQKYGKLYWLKFPGSMRMVMVNDVKLAKEIFFGSQFVDRPRVEVTELFTGGNYGIIGTNGKHWEEQRRWSLRKLRDYGFGKTSMEGIIMDEVNEVIEFYKKNEGKTVTIKERFNIATLNSLWTLLTGKRMSQEDPKIKSLMKAFDEIIPVMTRSGLFFAPWVKHIVPSVYKQVSNVADRVMGHSREAVATHFDTHVDGSSRDFIDEYINEIKGTTDTSSSFYKDIGRKNLEAVVSDLIQAGSETTSNTIIWAINYLAHYPEIQAKIQKELDQVIGSRPVSMSDKASMPYTEGVILETLRCSSLVSGGVQHATVEDTEVEGYTIPKGTWILTNMYYIHHDPKIWGDPENFRPERFLSPDGKKIVKNDALIPFQLGRRQCLGESLARDSLFLFISTIFQKFQITKMEKEKPQPQNSFFLVSEVYNFVFKSRQ